MCKTHSGNCHAKSGDSFGSKLGLRDGGRRSKGTNMLLHVFYVRSRMMPMPDAVLCQKPTSRQTQSNVIYECRSKWSKHCIYIYIYLRWHGRWGAVANEETHSSQANTVSHCCPYYTNVYSVRRTTYAHCKLQLSQHILTIHTNIPFIQLSPLLGHAMPLVFGIAYHLFIIIITDVMLEV